MACALVLSGLVTATVSPAVAATPASAAAAAAAAAKEAAAGPGVASGTRVAEPARAERRAERSEAASPLAGALREAQHGPITVGLGGEAKLDVPAGMMFIASPKAADVMRAMGNPGTYANLRGIVIPEDPALGQWIAPVSYRAEGYIRDDDAKDWNADELLSSYREGTKRANEERTKLGISVIEVEGWAEKPNYDPVSHRLVWAMTGRDAGAPADEAQTVNYNTYVLGRHGFYTLNLVGGLKDLPKLKPAAGTLLSGLEFRPGEKYTDFDKSTDKVAEYGLAALVVGVGAKKLGLVALVVAMFAKSAKLAIAAVVAVLAGLAKLFGRRGGDGPAEA